jgi:hypothetical protein
LRVVVIANIVEEKPPQTAFGHRNDVIQKLSPTAFDPVLRHPFLLVMESARDALCPDFESLRQFVPPAFCAQR